MLGDFERMDDERQSIQEFGKGIVVVSTSAEDDKPEAGQFTTPCSAGMKASTRTASSRKTSR